MARAMAGLLTAIILGGLCPAAPAQIPSLLPLPPIPTGTAAPSPAATVPPGSGTQAQLDASLADLPVGPLPPPAKPPAHIPGAYFEHDPLLDPAELPQPGWITDVGLRLVDPHVRYWSNVGGPVALLERRDRHDQRPGGSSFLGGDAGRSGGLSPAVGLR